MDRLVTASKSIFETAVAEGESLRQAQDSLIGDCVLSAALMTYLRRVPLDSDAMQELQEKLTEVLTAHGIVINERSDMSEGLPTTEWAVCLPDVEPSMQLKRFAGEIFASKAWLHVWDPFDFLPALLQANKRNFVVVKSAKELIAAIGTDTVALVKEDVISLLQSDEMLRRLLSRSVSHTRSQVSVTLGSDKAVAMSPGFSLVFHYTEVCPRDHSAVHLTADEILISRLLGLSVRLRNSPLASQRSEAEARVTYRQSLCRDSERQLVELLQQMQREQFDNDVFVQSIGEACEVAVSNRHLYGLALQSLRQTLSQVQQFRALAETGVYAWHCMSQLDALSSTQAQPFAVFWARFSEWITTVPLSLLPDPSSLTMSLARSLLSSLAPSLPFESLLLLSVALLDRVVKLTSPQHAPVPLTIWAALLSKNSPRNIECLSSERNAIARVEASLQALRPLYAVGLGESLRTEQARWAEYLAAASVLSPAPHEQGHEAPQSLLEERSTEEQASVGRPRSQQSTRDELTQRSHATTAGSAPLEAPPAPGTASTDVRQASASTTVVQDSTATPAAPQRQPRPPSGVAARHSARTARIASGASSVTGKAKPVRHLPLLHQERLLLWALLSPKSWMQAAYSYVCGCLGAEHLRPALPRELASVVTVLVDGGRDPILFALRSLERVGLGAKTRFLTCSVGPDELQARIAAAQQHGEQLVLMDVDRGVAPVLAAFASQFDVTGHIVHPHFRLIVVASTNTYLPPAMTALHPRVCVQLPALVQDRALAIYEQLLVARWAPHDRHVSATEKFEEHLSRSSVRTLLSGPADIPLLLRRLEDAVGVSPTATTSTGGSALPRMIVARQVSHVRFLLECWRGFVLAAIHAVLTSPDALSISSLLTVGDEVVALGSRPETSEPGQPPSLARTRMPADSDVEAMCQVLFSEELAQFDEFSTSRLVDLFYCAHTASPWTREQFTRVARVAETWATDRLQSRDDLIDMIMEYREQLPAWAAGACGITTGLGAAPHLSARFFSGVRASVTGLPVGGSDSACSSSDHASTQWDYPVQDVRHELADVLSMRTQAAAAMVLFPSSRRFHGASPASTRASSGDSLHRSRRGSAARIARPPRQLRSTVRTLLSSEAARLASALVRLCEEAEESILASDGVHRYSSFELAIIGAADRESAALDRRGDSGRLRQSSAASLLSRASDLSVRLRHLHAFLTGSSEALALPSVTDTPSLLLALAVDAAEALDADVGDVIISATACNLAPSRCREKGTTTPSAVSSLILSAALTAETRSPAGGLHCQPALVTLSAQQCTAAAGCLVLPDTGRVVSVDGSSFSSVPLIIPVLQPGCACARSIDFQVGRVQVEDASQPAMNGRVWLP
jgi:hypothetical protein